MYYEQNQQIKNITKCITSEIQDIIQDNRTSKNYTENDIYEVLTVVYNMRLNSIIGQVTSINILEDNILEICKYFKYLK